MQENALVSIKLVSLEAHSQTESFRGFSGKKNVHKFVNFVVALVESVCQQFVS